MILFLSIQYFIKKNLINIKYIADLNIMIIETWNLIFQLII